MVGAAPAHATTNGVTEYPIPTGGSSPEGITTGPDGALWFTELGANQIGRIDPGTGSVTEFPTTTLGSSPFGITKGPDGALWFTENAVGQIGRIDPTSHAVTEFTGLTSGSGPLAITTGPDGDLWFTESNVDQNNVAHVGRLNPTTSVITEFAVPGLPGNGSGSGPAQDMVAGPDGALWFTDGPLIGRVTTAGVVTVLQAPAPPGGAALTKDITVGPDGNLWYTDGNNMIGRVTPAGQFTTFTIPTQSSQPAGITTGPDGNLWFSEMSASQIGRFDPNTLGFTEFATPTGNAGPMRITDGPDSRLWFTENVAGQIGAITTTATPIPGISQVTPSSGPSGGGNSVTLTGSGFTGATAVTFTLPDQRVAANSVTTPATSFNTVSDTQVTAVVPMLAPGRYDVTVISTSGTPLVAPGQYVSLAPLAVTAVSPTSGEPLGGNIVTITGTGFTSTSSVSFGSTPATFRVISDDQITATSPPGTTGTTVDVTVTADQGTSATTSADRFSFNLVPVTVTSITPNEGQPIGGGTGPNNPMARSSAVTITGTGFVGVTAVNFGSTPALSFSVDSETQITAVSPTAPTDPTTHAPADNLTVDIQVSAVEGTSPAVPADRFTFSAKPILDFFFSPPNSPAIGRAILRISGFGLGGTTGVNFGDTQVSCPADCSAESDTVLDVVAPAHPIGGVTVTATNKDGTSLTGLPFAYTGVGTITAGANCPQSGSDCAEVGAKLLANGKVLGLSSSSVSGQLQANLYDPATGAWSSKAVCTGCDASNSYTLTPLPSGPVSVCGSNCGKALLTGGSFSFGAGVTPQPQAFLYDPTADTWSPTTNLPMFVGGDTATLLPSGRVLITGDGDHFEFGGTFPAPYGLGTEIYDPGTDTFMSAAPTHHEHFNSTATLLADGTVLLVGDGGSGSQTPLNGLTEIYDPSNNTWADTVPSPQPAFAQTATLLPDGRVLVTGGQINFSTNIASAEIYTPAKGSSPAAWQPAASMTFARYSHSATLMPNGTVLVVGGDEPQDTTSPPQQASSVGNNPSVGEIYDPASNTWVPTPPTIYLKETPNFGQDFTVRTVLLPSGPSSLCQSRCGQVLIVRGDDRFNNKLPIPNGAPTDALFTPPGVAGPAVTLSSPALTFGPAAVGSTSVAQTVTVTNSGSAPLSIHGVALSGAGTNQFVASADTCTGTTVAVGASCTVAVSFTPTANPPGSASLVFTDDAATSPQSVALSGSIGGPGVSVSPTSLSFGPVDVGSASLVQTATLTNTGSDPVAVTAVSLTGPGASSFLTTADTCSRATVAPQATCSVGIVFKPTSAGAASASLAISDGAPGSPQLVALSGTTKGAVGVSRLGGPNRIATAIAVSQHGFAAGGSAQAVVLARADQFPDALAGAPLAAAKGGPILLTESAQLDTATKAEIQRVLPSGGTVYLLGGHQALDPAIDQALSGLGYKPVRLAGPDRFATAVAVAGSLGDPSQVFEVTGTDFPDAISAGPAAIAAHGAILLSNGATESAATAAYLSSHAGDKRTAVGGPAAAADPGAFPVVGADRFATSAMVAGFFSAPPVVALATGTAFPDALSGAPALGSAGGPLLLVNPSGPLPASVAAYLSAHGRGATSLIVLGGTAAVGSDVVTSASAAMTGP